MGKAFNGIEGAVWGQFPVQGVGRVDGYPWYFRERMGSWYFEIVEDKAIDPACLPLEFLIVGGWCVEDVCFDLIGDAGEITEEDAWKLIEAAIAMFRQGSLTYIASRS